MLEKLFLETNNFQMPLNTSNVTYDNDISYDTQRLILQYFVPACFAIITIIGVMGNILVILVYVTNRKLQVYRRFPGVP